VKKTHNAALELLSDAQDDLDHPESSTTLPLVEKDLVVADVLRPL